ncbi:McrC family protein [Acetobacteroides hydrogenigenes]|uniref:5-methylcytosine-specific restriction enzyme subunit McrC n=1 Tax=Acetobacteroides hydrogenigenes TaxID=979970 RepID=A0A4R2EK63_9BACT|nr:restriction endonuclease [Acetobacteroides hydrogenigenes]TCN67676.1 5-methylcytosine-specific restriction enzyme subunit McrC [Acetobacteroides hydrogenigenes]
MEPIRVFEYETLSTTDASKERRLDTKVLDALYKLNDDSGGKYFTPTRNGVKFGSYVGVLQVGGTTIEILPKIDRKTDNDYDCWQKVLLKMLAVCNHIKVESVSDASLKRRYNSLLDLYFNNYLDEVAKLLHQGLVKRYRKEASNVSALKGRICFGRHIQQNLIHKERFYTEHQVYDQEHLLNQILLCGIRVLSRVSCNPFIKDKINRLLLDFPEIVEKVINEKHFEQVRLNRKTKPYEEALKIAKMIILNYSPDIKNGSEGMIALLFDMNKLWEEYVYRMLKREEKDGVEILPQQQQKFWNSKAIRPDIVIKKDGKVFIVDTKWKIVDPGNPSDADLKQMYAYNMYWDAPMSMLLYPSIKDEIEMSGAFHKGRDGVNRCKMGFVNILNEDKTLNLSIGDVILRKCELSN